MPRLIKNRTVVDDAWTLVREAATPADLPWLPSIVPLALWRAHRDELSARGDIGVWLAPTDDPAVLAEDTQRLPLIAIEFPKFTDGRGYSIGRLLRDRYGFKGELRAIGDILRDQLYALSECGFDAFALRADRDPVAALASLDDFQGVYASTSRTPQPWFRRRAVASETTPGATEYDRRVTAATELLRNIATVHAPATLASSFGAEDMVLVDLVARNDLPIAIFALDTGRLPDETYALIDRTRERYRVPIEIYMPDAKRLESFVRDNGVNAFYRSVDLRKECCAVRKTEPLQRALAGKRAWITGLRRGQSAGRKGVPLEEFDTVHGLLKFNPLAEWSDDDVWHYIRANRVPYNALHDRGFPSIGCAPCTRAITPGEDPRAGRWWWEERGDQECGLHTCTPRPVARSQDTSKEVTT